MITRGTGYRCDPPEVVARRPDFHLLRARRGLSASALPLATHNRARLARSQGGPGILQQSATGSCTGHATGGAITMRFAILARPIALVSPIGCYTVGRAMARRRVNGVLPPLTDDGAEPSQVIAGIREWGVCSADTWGSFPADPSTINDEPTLDLLEAAAEFELAGAYFLHSTGDTRCLDLMTALAAGYPTTNAVAASGSKFQSYTGGVLGALSGPLDHYTYLLDYEWDGMSLASLVLYGVNSWGDGSDRVYPPWGEAGLYRANRDFLEQSADLAVLDVAPVTTGASLQ